MAPEILWEPNYLLLELFPAGLNTRGAKSFVVPLAMLFASKPSITFCFVRRSMLRSLHQKGDISRVRPTTVIKYEHIEREVDGTMWDWTWGVSVRYGAWT